MIQGLFNSGAMPALERLVQYTGSRHRLILHNIANLSTPNFRPQDVAPAEFQKVLAEAIDQRRDRASQTTGPLEMRHTRQIRFDETSTQLRPDDSQQNILFHDRNNRSLEHLMKNLNRNTSAHNAALQLLKNQFEMLEKAIRERV